MYAQEYNDQHRDNAVEYCEMCGAEISDGVPDRRNASRAAEAISAIAHMYVESPRSTAALLRKVVDPHASYSAIAKAEGCGKSEICRKLSGLAESYPDLVGLLGFRSVASRSQARVREMGSRSSYRGVTWHKHYSKWQSQVSVNGKVVYCGRYAEEIDAARAYNETAIKLLGTAAKLNVLG